MFARTAVSLEGTGYKPNLPPLVGCCVELMTSKVFGSA